MYGSSQKGNFFKSLLIALGDCLMVFLAMLAALASMGEKYDISSLNLAPVIVYAVAFCAVCFGLDMYSIINRKKYDLLLGVLISCCIASVVAMVFDYFFAGVSRTRMLAVVFLLSFLLGVLLLIFLRLKQGDMPSCLLLKPKILTMLWQGK